MRGRGISACLSVLFLVAGCGQVIGGSAVPDPVVVALPRVGADDVGDVILSQGELEGIVSTSGLSEVYETSSRSIPTSTINPSRCAALVFTGHTSVYGDDWSALRTRIVQQPGEYSHVVYQTVVTFRNFLGAEGLVDRYREVLGDCRDREVAVTEPGEETLTWRIIDGSRKVAAGQNAVAWASADVVSTWVCENFARALGNAVIEASVCAFGNSYTATAIADRIAEAIGRR